MRDSARKLLLWPTRPVKSSSMPNSPGLETSLVGNKLSAYAVARAVRLAPYQVVQHRPASHQMLARFRAEDTPHTEWHDLAGSRTLHSTKPAVVDCRSPMAAEVEKSRYASGLVGQPVVRPFSDDRRGGYGWYQPGYVVPIFRSRRGLGRRQQPSLHNHQKPSRDKLSGRWTDL